MTLILSAFPSRFLNDNKGSPEVEEERVNATIEGEEGRMKVSIEDDQRALPAAQGISLEIPFLPLSLTQFPVMGFRLLH